MSGSIAGWQRNNFKMKVEIIYYDFFDICFKEIA